MGVTHSVKSYLLPCIVYHHANRNATLNFEDLGKFLKNFYKIWGNGRFGIKPEPPDIRKRNSRRLPPSRARNIQSGGEPMQKSLPRLPHDGEGAQFANWADEVGFNLSKTPYSPVPPRGILIRRSHLNSFISSFLHFLKRYLRWI